MRPIFSRSEPLSNVDAAWLRMEDPTNLMMVTGLLIFDEPLDFVRLRATVEQRLLRFNQFRQRVASSSWRPNRWFWETVDNFDLSDHLDRLILPPSSDEAMLQTVINTMISTPLNYERPLWQLHLIENVGDGSALLFRLHHALADGMALLRVLLSLTDETPDAPWPSDESSPEVVDPFTALVAPLINPAKTTLKSSLKMAQETRATLEDPARAATAVKQGLAGAVSLGRLALRKPDPPTLLRGPLGIAKRVNWTQPVSLDAVKQVGRALGGTVNDILLSTMTGALRRYLLQHGEPVEGLNFRAAVPVNLRSPDEPVTLGNKFGLVFLSLPVGVAHPLERLYEFKRRMGALKQSPEAGVVYGLLNAVALTTPQMQNRLVDYLGSKATCVMTNVPGPRQTLYFAGSPIRSMMFWVPQSGRLGMGISILSYAGQVSMGVVTDADLVPDPEAIIAGFEAEFEAFQQFKI